MGVALVVYESLKYKSIFVIFIEQADVDILECISANGDFINEEQ